MLIVIPYEIECTDFTTGSVKEKGNQFYDNGGVHSRRWYSLSAYGYDMQNGRLDIQGAVTQSLACSQTPCNPNLDNTAQEGYLDLYSALLSDQDTSQLLKWSTDLGYSGY